MRWDELLVNRMHELKNITPELAAMEGMLPRVLREPEHYRDNHRLLLIVSCSFAELLIGTLIEEKCKNGKQINSNTRDFPFSVRLTLLHEMGLLHDLHLQRFNWLRKQRNDAAHNPGFRFTADRLPDWVGDAHRTPDKLFSLCANILCIFWNNHVYLFREKLPVDA
jgi:hypothetical protein